jgi:cobalt-zinc-cadmium efflux system membrane fusion protein
MNPMKFATAVMTTWCLVACGQALSGCHKNAQEKVKAAFLATTDSVSIDGATNSSVRFVTEEAISGKPLPLPPFSARVATLETLTSPSFAALAGRVVKVNIRLGDHVKEGDRIIEVRTADLPTLEHDLQAAQLSIKTRKAIVERLEKLVEARVASQNDLTVANSELDEAKLAARAASDKIRSLSIQQDGPASYWVLAHRSGTVVQLEASVGKLVRPDSDKPIATVAELNEVLILADVAQKNVAEISAGQTAEIRLPDHVGAGIEGTVESVSDVVDPDRQTVPVRIRVSNAQKMLRPNAFVDVVITPPSVGTVVTVPSTAIVSDGAHAVVFVETKPGTYLRRAVDVGRQSKDRTEIMSGLSTGERIVSTSALLLLNALPDEG